MATTSPEQFFYDHAGYSYDPKRETPEQGRRKCARLLARAERKGSEAGLSFEWQHDDITSDEFKSSGSPWRLWACVCRSVDGEILSSLGGIDFGRDGEPWGDTYRRVIEAELALEAKI